MARVIIGMGTNLGDREAELKYAVGRLTEGFEFVAASSVYETAPVGFLDQPDFLNQVVVIDTDLEPDEVLSALLGIEQEMGRKRVVKWGPRVIDLDLLFYDDLVYESVDLLIPHPRIAERRFVLEPLAELFPDFVHPVLGKSVFELLKELTDNSIVRKLS